MDFGKLDPDFFARAGSYTPHIFRDVYPGIDPKSEALSLKGKTVVITGATGGIGAGLITAFALANVRAMVLLGRSEQKLAERAGLVKQEYPSVQVFTVATDIVNKPDVDNAVSFIGTKLGKADILVNNAGALGSPSPVTESSIGAWW